MPEKPRLDDGTYQWIRPVLTVVQCPHVLAERPIITPCFLSRSIAATLKGPLHEAVLSLIQTGLTMHEQYAKNYSRMGTGTVVVKITPKDHVVVEDIAAKHFGGNISMALGWLAKIGHERPLPDHETQKKIDPPAEICTELPRMGTERKKLNDWSDLPASFGSCTDLTHVRVTLGISKRESSRIIGVANSTYREYEKDEDTPLTASRRRLVRFSIMTTLLEWGLKHVPERVPLCGEEARLLLKTNGIGYDSMELHPGKHPQTEETQPVAASR